MISIARFYIFVTFECLLRVRHTVFVTYMTDWESRWTHLIIKPYGAKHSPHSSLFSTQHLIHITAPGLQIGRQCWFFFYTEKSTSITKIDTPIVLLNKTKNVIRSTLNRPTSIGWCMSITKHKKDILDCANIKIIVNYIYRKSGIGRRYAYIKARQCVKNTFVCSVLLNNCRNTAFNEIIQVFRRVS